MPTFSIANENVVKSAIPGTSMQVVKPRVIASPSDNELNAPINVVFLCDISGSMNTPARLPVMKQGVLDLIQSLKPADTFSVVVFDDEPSTIIANQPVRNFNNPGLINAIQTKNSTNFVAAMKGLDRKLIPSINNTTIILLTDGECAPGITNNMIAALESNLYSPSQLAVAQKQKTTLSLPKILTVGIGPGFKEEELDKLRKKTDPTSTLKTLKAPDSGAFQSIFNILKNELSPRTDDITIKTDCPVTIVSYNNNPIASVSNNNAATTNTTVAIQFQEKNEEQNISLGSIPFNQARGHFMVMPQSTQTINTTLGNGTAAKITLTDTTSINYDVLAEWINDEVNTLIVELRQSLGLAAAVGGNSNSSVSGIISFHDFQNLDEDEDAKVISPDVQTKQTQYAQKTARLAYFKTLLNNANSEYAVNTRKAVEVLIDGFGQNTNKTKQEQIQRGVADLGALASKGPSSGMLYFSDFSNTFRKIDSSVNNNDKGKVSVQAINTLINVSNDQYAELSRSIEWVSNKVIPGVKGYISIEGARTERNGVTIDMNSIKLNECFDSLCKSIQENDKTEAILRKVSQFVEQTFPNRDTSKVENETITFNNIKTKVTNLDKCINASAGLSREQSLLTSYLITNLIKKTSLLPAGEVNRCLGISDNLQRHSITFYQFTDANRHKKQYLIDPTNNQSPIYDLTDANQLAQAQVDYKKMGLEGLLDQYIPENSLKPLPMEKATEINNNTVLAKEALDMGFTCPISCELFTDPVIITSTVPNKNPLLSYNQSYSYDRDGIHEWIQQGTKTDPQTRSPIINIPSKKSGFIQDRDLLIKMKTYFSTEEKLSEKPAVTISVAQNPAIISAPVKQTIRAISFDFDGCIFNTNYNPSDPNTLLSANETLLTALKNEKYKETIVMIGSNRQSKAVDDNNGGFFGKTCFTAVQTIATHLNATLDKFLLSDIDNPVDLPFGTSFDRAIGAINNTYDGNHSNWRFDETKVSILYAQIHKTALAHPDEDIEFSFYDDRNDILNTVSQYFTDHPELLPANVKLLINQYDGKEPLLIKTLTGTGFIDKNFSETVKAMDKISMSKCKANGLTRGINVARDVTDQASIQQLNEIRQAALKPIYQVDTSISNNNNVVNNTALFNVDLNSSASVVGKSSQTQSSNNTVINTNANTETSNSAHVIQENTSSNTRPSYRRVATPLSENLVNAAIPPAASSNVNQPSNIGFFGNLRNKINNLLPKTNSMSNFEM